MHRVDPGLNGPAGATPAQGAQSSAQPSAQPAVAWQADELAGLYADLVGVPEIAAGLGVSVFRVRRWIERRASTGCPSPVRVLSCGNIYSLADWRGWFGLWRLTRGSETWNRKSKDGTPGE